MINGGVATPLQQTLELRSVFYPLTTTRPWWARQGSNLYLLFLLGFGIEGWDRTTDLKIISFAFYQLNYSDMYGGE